MATKIDAGEVSRGEVYAISPEYIIVSHDNNGSRWMEHTPERVQELVESFEQQGQLQPVQVRKVEDNKVQLVFGFGRWHAATEYNKKHPDKPMKLKCIVVNCNAEEALMRNIVENRNRAEVSQVDDAYAARRLMEEFQWNQSRVAKFFGTDPGYIGNILELLKLPKETQLQVHKKLLSYEAALGLTKMSEEEAKPILSEISKEIAETGAKVTTSKVKAKVRAVVQANGGKIARSMKELIDGITALTGPAENVTLRTVCNEIIKYREGKTSDKTFEKNMRKLFGSGSAKTEEDAAAAEDAA